MIFIPDTTFVAHFAHTSPETTDVDRLVNLYWVLAMQISRGIRGDIVEVGAYKGCTSGFLAASLVRLGAKMRRVIAFESFSGMPKPAAGIDGVHLKRGDFLAEERDWLVNAPSYPMAEIELVVGNISDTLKNRLPQSVALAYVDLDYFDATGLALRALESRLAPGGVIVVDDYFDSNVNPSGCPDLPGVARAVDDFVAESGMCRGALIARGDLSFATLYRK